MASQTLEIRRSFFPSRPSKDSLPITQTTQNGPLDQGLRRRLSSLSLKLQPISSPSTSWGFARPKSMSFIGEYAGNSLRSWWTRGWAWIISKKPTFAVDLEMNEEESVALGHNRKGTWAHVFYKARSEFRKLVGSDQLPIRV